MSEIKILHCADIHIGSSESFLGQKATSRRAETLLTFKKAVSLATDEGVKLFLIAGDLFDCTSVDNSFLRETLSCIEAASDIKFIYSAGNHDPFDVNSPLKNRSLPSNLYIFDTSDSVFTFDDLSVKVYGRSFGEVYDKGEAAFGIMPDENYINIMCIHGELTNSVSDYNPITSSFIEKSGMDYIALGHVHKFTGIGQKGKTSFAYSGCIEGQGFDEAGDKGVIIGTVSKSGVNLDFRAIALRNHILHKEDISGINSADTAAEKILSSLEEKYGESYAENLYKIVLTGTLEENTVKVQDITALLSEKLYFVKLKDKTAPDVNLELLSAEPSLKGIFVKNMLVKIENAKEDEKQILTDALYLGLKSFSTEVRYNED